MRDVDWNNTLTPERREENAQHIRAGKMHPFSYEPADSILELNELELKALEEDYGADMDALWLDASAMYPEMFEDAED